MLKTNFDRVVKLSVQGKVAYPAGARRFEVDAEGKPFIAPSIGGISYNVKIGDPAFGWAGDHVEPGVSTLVDEEKRYGFATTSYHFYSCVGNEAVVVTGDAKKKKGIVTGHHGGAEHVILDFADEVLEKLNMDDKFLVKGWGQGLKLMDYPDIHLTNLDPNLVNKMGIKEVGKGRIEVPVAAVVPGHLMGSGVGSLSMGTGDYDIMTTDRDEIAELGLDKLLFGDFVAITDHDNVYGRSWRRGAVTIGIIIHSDCLLAGHGPGVTTLISCVKPMIVPRVDKGANIGRILKIGRFRPPKKKRSGKKK
ncbi:DUF4438 domain-containing protein [candidate division WOR-3 bacterium]|nr:DUF4438 domain-containing protein [candidate division WOR-3 bacterium]